MRVVAPTYSVAASPLVRLLVTAIGLLIAPGRCDAGFLTTIDFSQYHDTRIQDIESGRFGNAAAYPEGALSFGGIPFLTPVGGLNAWAAGTFQGQTGTQSITIAVGIYGVDKVYTLINTIWGERDPGSLASISFNGSNGDVYVVELDGNDHIRDWLYGGYTNNINGTTTVNAFVTMPGIIDRESRLDRQTFDLPSVFDSQTLVSITLTDTGAIGVQRLLVYGITVDSVAVPEPSSLALATTGVMALAGYGSVLRRRRTR